MTSLYWILFIGIVLASWLVSMSVEAKYKKYSQNRLPLTGKEVAQKMLNDNGIYDVRITCVKGQLTDHYNPATKTVNLSEGVYNGANVAAAAVAAHECGHALQHAQAYGPLKLRSALVPVVSFSSNWVTWIILGGLLFLGTPANEQSTGWKSPVSPTARPRKWPVTHSIVPLIPMWLQPSVRLPR